MKYNDDNNNDNDDDDDDDDDDNNNNYYDYFAYLIREKHCGGVAPGFKVCHKNGVTVGTFMKNLDMLSIK